MNSSSGPSTLPGLRRQWPAVAVSLLVHAAVLTVMALVTIVTQQSPPPTIETVFADPPRVRDQFVQELDDSEEIAETVTFVAGGASTEIGGSDSTVTQQNRIRHEEVIREPDFTVDLSDVAVPAMETLGEDLGQREVTGEIGAVVEGYQAALDRLTRELIRLMRQDKLLVVWLFDESKSMKDDQQELKDRIYRVYEELQLVEESPESIGASGGQDVKLQDVLLTAVTSFGAQYHAQTPKPTGDRQEIMAAIDRIPVEKNGTENMCRALMAALEQFGGAVRADRRLVLIVVSDESGDDGALVEEVLNRAQRLRAPIYVLGREAVFGSRFAHVRWKQPYTGDIHYLPVRRGPETPDPEQLQHDGYRKRRDSHMSGFGPYEQVRLAKETGGIFFQLPGEQADLNDFADDPFDALSLREYAPSYQSRREYVRGRDQSRFRRAIWEVIGLLNPYAENNDWMQLPDPEVTREKFTTNPADYMPAIQKRIQKIVRMLGVFAKAQQRLEQVRSLRSEEPSVRWRANYDLTVAQLAWYRVRLFEYGIALGQWIKTGLRERLQKHPEHNRWLIRESPSDFAVPDEQQQKLLGVSPEELIDARDRARSLLETVKEQHPGTPWADRAEWELKRKFGVKFGTYRFEPSKKPSKPQPDPPPPPKL